MKTAVLASLRVDPALREAAESVLQDCETLSSFVEQAVQQRKQQKAFIARGLTSRDRLQASGRYITAKEVLENLQSRLSAAQKGWANRFSLSL